MTTFNNLNIPDQWQQYYTKYPEGYTILEALLNWVQQVNDMVGNVNEWNIYLDDFKNSFDTDLQGTVEDTLKEWQQTGFLGDIINTALQTQLDSIEVELQQKATKTDIQNMGSFSPKGVYATLAALQAAYPTGTTGTFVVTADGYWYYWNGTAWTQGATYQSTGITDGSITPEKVSAAYLKTYKNIAYQNGGYLVPSYSGSTSPTYIGSMGNYNNLPAGNYLVYVDFSLSGADLLNATFNPMLFDGTNIKLPATNVQTPAYANAADKTHFIAYGIVNIAVAGNFRTGIYVSNMNTGRTNTLTMNVNKLYVIAMDIVNQDVINNINFFADSLTYAPVISLPDMAQNKKDIASLKQSVPSFSPIMAFGDSMTGATTGWVNQLSVNYGVNIQNRGIGGQTAGQIATRQGGLPLIVQPFTIPADTSEVPVTVNETLYANQSGYEGINPVYINGIQGTLKNATNTSGGFTFKRNAAGTQTQITRPTVVITDNMKTYRQNPMIIWVGTNGDYDDSSRTSDKIIEIIDYMLDYGECKKYLIIGLTTDTIYNIPAINTDLAKKYGRRFLDLRSYLIQYGLSDMGITATADDTSRIAANNVPSSLKSDDTHLTSACQQQMVAPLVYKKLQELYMI